MNKKSMLALIGGFVGSLTASAAAQPRQPTHIACVGDSITAGTGASSMATNYPSDLQRLFGSAVVVKNFGHSGATLLSTGDKPYTAQPEYTSATSFVVSAGASSLPDVIIMLGTNDSKPANWNTTSGTRVQQFITDYAALIDHFTSLATPPAVYLALPLSALTNTYTISGALIESDIIPAIKQVAMQKGLATIDLNGPTAAHPEYLTDGVHPNDNGYEIVAQAMHDGLLRVPQVTLTAALRGASVVNLSAEATSENVPITSVAFLLGTRPIGTAVQAPYTASWTSPAPGSYAFSAKATDKTGATATSNSVQVSVTASAGSGGTNGGEGGSTSTTGGTNAAGGSAGTAGAATAAGTDSGGAATGTGAVSAGGASVAGASPNLGGAAAADPGTPADGAGCSCRFNGRGAGSGARYAPLLMLAALGLRRVRRRSLERGRRRLPVAVGDALHEADVRAIGMPRQERARQ
jgi:acyl-CoA thioesterase I